ncbi:MAG: Ig domain-containing protein [Bryobacteraceae bacterium]
MTVTAPEHGLAAGDTVWVSFVGGTSAANGVRKVLSVAGDRISLGNPDGSPVAGNGEYDATAGAGFIGKVQATRLTGHPRLLLDGPEGAITARVKDPDGTGAARAPAAKSGYAPYEALAVRLNARVRNPEQQYASPDVQGGDTVLMAALGWYMDNRRTDYLEAARHWINNADKMLGSETFSACDETLTLCGRGSYTDWGSFWAANFAYAYSIIREQLTAPERAAFTAKMFNGMDGTGCRNMLEDQPGKMTLEAGSTTVSGEGTRFTSLRAGQWIHTGEPLPSGAWLKIARVDSDTAMTVTAIYSRTVAIRGAGYGAVQAWQADSCGLMWFVSHHAYGPLSIMPRALVRLVDAVGPESRELRVDKPGQLPPPPFFLKMDYLSEATGRYATEWVRVNGKEQDRLQVERGVLGTSAAAHTRNRIAVWTPLPVSGGLGTLSSFYFVPMDDPRNNLTFTKTYGYLVVGLALADETPAAVSLAEKAWNYFYDFTYPHAKDMWTGITQGGYYYGVNRWLEWMLPMTLFGQKSFQPGIDISGGNWLKQGLLYPMYMTTPYNPAFSMRYADAGIEEELLPRHLKYIVTGQAVYGGTAEASYANHWYANVAKWLDVRVLQGATGFNNIPWALAYFDPDNACGGDNCRDYRKELPPYHFFTETDYDPEWNPNSAFQAVVSKQNWDEDATMLFALALSRPVDHLAGYPGPGAYRISKKEVLLADNSEGGSGFSNPNRSNYVEIDGGNKLVAEIRPNLLGALGPNPVIDRKTGSDQYVYFRVNSRYAYTAEARVNRAYRHFVHWKENGGRDAIVVYDDVATDVPKPKKTRLHYWADKSTTPAFEARGADLVFTRQQARLSTRVVLPEVGGAGLTAAMNQPRTGETAYTVELDGGAGEESEFLVAHFPSANTADSMPAVRRMRELSDGFQGIEVDSNTPWASIFARGDGRKEVRFRTERAVKAVVAGLQPGVYTLEGNGGTREVRVNGDGTLVVEGGPGTYAVRQTQSTATLRILTGALVAGAAGVAYKVFLGAAEGTPPYRWSLSGGTLPAGMELSAEGELRGTPSRAGTSTFTARVTDASAPPQTADRAFVLRVEARAPAVEIATAELPVGVFDAWYDAHLEARGGTAPFRWSATGLPSGLQLESTSGILYGTPAESGNYALRVRVVDAAGETAEQEIALVVLASAAELRVVTEGVPDGVEGGSYQTVLEAYGGIRPYKWSVTGGALPTGLAMTENGEITGTPEAAGVAEFTVTVVDGGDPVRTASRVLSITVASGGR